MAETKKAEAATKNMKTKHVGLWNGPVYHKGTCYMVEDMGLIRDVSLEHAKEMLAMPGWSEWGGHVPEKPKRQAVKAAAAPPPPPTDAEMAAAAAARAAPANPFPEVDVAPPVSGPSARNQTRGKSS